MCGCGCDCATATEWSKFTTATMQSKVSTTDTCLYLYLCLCSVLRAAMKKQKGKAEGILKRIGESMRAVQLAASEPPDMRLVLEAWREQATWWKEPGVCASISMHAP